MGCRQDNNVVGKEKGLRFMDCLGAWSIGRQVSGFMLIFDEGGTNFACAFG